jgi:hypothetical protein
VYVEETRVGATNWSYIKRSGLEWARSSRVHVVFVKRCPSKYYCVKVYDTRSSRNLAGWATLITTRRPTPRGMGGGCVARH